MRSKKLILSVITILSLLIVSLLNFKSNTEKELFNIIQSNPQNIDFSKLSVDWDRAILLRPYESQCFKDGKCIDSTYDSDCILILAKEELVQEVIAVDKILPQLCVNNFPKYYPKEHARFALSHIDGVVRLTLADQSWIGTYSKSKIIKLQLNDPVGEKPYCKIFLSGVGSCVYTSLSECEKSLNSESNDEACTEKKLGKIVELKWTELWNSNWTPQTKR